MKLGTFLQQLFAKAGIPETDELKPLFALDTDVNDETAGKVGKALLTMEAAKSNPEIRKMIKAEALNGADQRIASLVEEMGLEVDDAFTKEPNTYEKIAKLTKLVEANAIKKAGAKGVDKDKFVEKEAEYNRLIKQLRDDIKKQTDDFSIQREDDLTAYEIKALLSGKDYVFPKEMDSQLKIDTAFGVIKSGLAKKELTIKRKDGKLVILNKEGMPAHSDTNEPLEANTFIEGALAHNKLLRINGSDPNQQQHQQGPQNLNIPGQAQKGNPVIAQELEAQLKSDAFK